MAPYLSDPAKGGDSAPSSVGPPRRLLDERPSAGPGALLTKESENARKTRPGLTPGGSVPGGVLGSADSGKSSGW